MAAKKRRLENRTALITGASRGLGRAMAVRFAAEGAAVAVNYVVNREAAEQVCRTITQAGGKALSVQADVADESKVKQMVATVIKEFGRIDILVNNAGLLLAAPLLEVPLADVDRMYEVNIKGILHCTQAVGPFMVEKKYGRILNLSSIAALGTAFIGTSAYAATKAAVVVLTKRMAFEFGPHNITVNAISPGFIKTDMTVPDLSSPATQQKIENTAKKAMLGRVGEPEDIANAALFLVSDEASFLTSQTITVDGGRMDFLSYSV